MKSARWMEMITWVVGVALLSSYAILRVSAERDRRDGVQAFLTLRHAALAQAPAAAVGSRHHQVDQSHWSQGRVQAYQRTRLQEIPQGILRVPALGLVVPIYSGTRSSELDRGAGHIQGTAALDAAGNAAIAGHRDGSSAR